MRLSSYQRASLNAVAVNREHMRRTGRTRAGQLLWTEDELSLLDQLYPDYAALAAALPGRTRKAIECKAAKLGISTRVWVWRPEQFRTMKPPYVAGVPVGEIAVRVDKSKRQVWSKAAANQIRRPRKPPKPTGMPLVDAVRQRAFELRFTMAELDAEVGCRRYFRSPKGHNWRALSKAIKILGGEAMVEWPE